MKKCKSIQKDSLQVNRLFKSKRKNLKRHKILKSWMILFWICHKNVLSKIHIFWHSSNFLVHCEAIDIQSGFWTLSRLFLCKTQQALCMTQRDSLCTVPGQGAVHKLCRHRPSFLYCVASVTNKLCRLGRRQRGRKGVKNRRLWDDIVYGRPLRHQCHPYSKHVMALTWF